MEAQFYHLVYSNCLPYDGIDCPMYNLLPFIPILFSLQLLSSILFHFYCLRDVVPGTHGDGRVSKVAILRRAVDHIRQLAADEALQAEHSRQICCHLF